MTVPWRELVQSTIENLGRRAPDTSPTTAPPVPPPSNASLSQSRRGQMPQNSPVQLTKTIGAFLGTHDNAACAPIHIASDDEVETADEKRQTAESGLPLTQSRGTILRQRNQRPESRDEARLMGGLVRRESGAVQIEDPMKKPFKTPTGPYRPHDTLGGRSAFLHQRTYQARAPVNGPSTRSLAKNDVHANDHSAPNKKRKIGDGRGFGSSTASAIDIHDSQDPNDSEDELALYPKSTGLQSRGKTQRPCGLDDTEDDYVSTRINRNTVHDSQISEVDRLSPEDESAFTKGSAQQRKLEKDKILESPPHSLNRLPAQPRTSPYFTYPQTRTADGNWQKQNPNKAAMPESPDALQSGETPSIPGLQVMSVASYPQMKTKDLGNLIIGGNSSPVTDKRSNVQIKKPVNMKMRFVLKELVYRDLLDTSGYTIELSKSEREVVIGMEDPLLGDEPLSGPRGINSIFRLEHGNNQSPLVTLHFSRISMVDDKMYLRFESHKEAIDFVRFLQGVDKTLKVRTKEEEWMERAFTRAKTGTKRLKSSPIKTPRPTETSSVKSEPPITTGPGTCKKRLRCVDTLDAPDEVHNMDTTLPATKKRAAPEASMASEESAHSSVLPPKATRPRADVKQPSGEQKQSEVYPKIKVSETGILGKRWTQDLIYPQPGRRAAVVPFEDLRRLDYDEYLNDNLISFFMRYLETHMEKSNPELYKRMHFFNTYFYAALSKTKGKKGVNYEAVSRWTKNINLFSRDFVVVPVNESYHWYLAIICNLPYFLGGHETKSGWSEELQLSDQQSEEGERDIELPTDETQRTLADLSLSDDEKNSHPRTKKRPGRRKLVRRSLPKYDVNKPVIITLDSLGSSRSATCAQLKQYVVLEARDKRNMDIDVSELKGMTAKEIPTQNNFSDCGLYLCVYLEQFVADPYNFVRRILQREENAQQWPRRIHSEDLRSRLLQLILEMHRRQEKQPSQMEDPAIGNILIDKREVSFSPPVSQKPRTRQDIQEAQQRFEGITRSHASDSGEDYDDVSPDPEVRATKTRNSVTDVSKTQEDSVNEDGNGGFTYGKMPPAPAEQTRATRPARDASAEPSRLDKQLRASPQPRDGHPALNMSSVSHTTPTEQVAQARRQNAEHYSHKRQRLSHEDDLDMRRRSRSSSQTSELTDYLSGAAGIRTYLPGIEIYAARASASLSPDEVVNDHRDGRAFAAERNLTRDEDRARKSACPSPEPEVIGERKVVPNMETQFSEKRKRPPGKATAPNSASEYEKLVGLEARRDIELLQTGRTQFS